MTGETHRAGGMLCSVIGFCILKDNNLLLPNVNQFVQLAVIYPFCMYGSVMSDLDHHWDSCPEKDIPSWMINKTLHLTTPLYRALDTKYSQKQKESSLLYKFASLFSASHRSWQTHSDLTLFAMLFLLYKISKGVFSNVLGSVDVTILSLILTGLCIGVSAHFILDMLTPQGVWSVLNVIINKVVRSVFGVKWDILPKKIHFVPHMKCFATDSSWEKFICKLLKIATFLAVAYVIFYIAFPNVIPYVLSLIPFQVSIG